MTGVGVVFDCVRVFTIANMERANYSIASVSLETPRPEIDAPDFAERRIYARLFPKDAAERDCYHHLLSLMRTSPNRQVSTEAELKAACRRQFGVTVESFRYTWAEAIKVSGANWDKPGRRSR